MEMILFMGLQATGKSSFYREKLFRSHVRLSLDMLRTRHREKLLLDACIAGKTKFVVDNTNLSREERARFIQPTKASGFRVVGYFFESKVTGALRRNAVRPEGERVPDKAILGSSNRLQIPSIEEGFDELLFVRIAGDNQFSVEKWRLNYQSATLQTSETRVRVLPGVPILFAIRNSRFTISTHVERLADSDRKYFQLLAGRTT